MRCSFVKRWVERTRLAPVYRAARDEWRFAGLRFAQTPFGYKLAGPRTMQTGAFEAAEVALLKQHLSSADVFVDIGANVGYFTCLARSMGKQVVAVEPHWGNLRYLYANLQVNGWTDGVDICPMGLSDKPGLVWLYGGGTDASLLSGWSGASEAFKRTIPVTTLDALLSERFSGRRVLVKMDVEGAEYKVLQGAVETLRATPRPLWLVEISIIRASSRATQRAFPVDFRIILGSRI